jgi:CheY-like chemotaxis protein
MPADDTFPAATPDAPNAPPPPPPANRFTLGGEIARGGMGEVYAARDHALGREVAVKVLAPRLVGTAAGRRFHDEARITGQLQHPGVPPVYDLGTLPDGRPFLAMKLVKGRTLDNLIEADGPGGHWTAAGTPCPRGWCPRSPRTNLRPSAPSETAGRWPMSSATWASRREVRRPPGAACGRPAGRRIILSRSSPIQPRGSASEGGRLDPRPRVLVVGPTPAGAHGLLRTADVVAAEDAAAAVERLRADAFVAVVLDPRHFAAGLSDLLRDELVLRHVETALATLDPAGVVTWANPVLRAWCPDEPVGKPLVEAVGATVVAAAADPFAAARAGRAAAFRLHRPASPDRPYLDVTVSPVEGPDGTVRELVASARNVSPEVEQQKKLDALHAAGRELSGLDPSQLAEMNTPTRVELLKQNLRRYIHDLLRYDIIEVRVLDRRTGELRPLLEDGMTAEAAKRVLFAKTQANGVTGFVAATGQSYLCPDTAADPLYLQGAAEARSSMTVPLKHQDEVIGTLNVESPRPRGFGADDLQFTELFSKEIAAALHTLDLLTAQQECTASQSIEAVSREIALPVDEVLGGAATLLQRVGDSDPDTAAQLRKILAAARQVKARVREVGGQFATEPVPDGPLAGKRVLVVDADERIRRSAHLLLTRLGAGVEAAGTAGEGVALSTGEPFDAVFVEVKPADMGGYEAFRRLRAACPAARVSLTTGFGYDAAHSIVKARADGLKAVLFKPFRQDQVVRAVLDGAAPPPAGGNGKSA